MALTDSERQDLIWKTMREDTVFAARFWTIKHPMGARKWELYPTQEEILRSWEDGENHIHLKARQIGFSTSVAFKAWHTAGFIDESSTLLISKGEREAVELLDKVKFGIDRMGDFVRGRAPKIVQRTQTKLTFSNGSEILSLPSASDPARGYTGKLIIVDEWAFLPNPGDAWASIEPTSDIGGQIIGLSTANGSGNFFHELWVRAERGESTFKAMFYPWWSVPGRDEEWYAKKQKDMLDWQLHQEYPATPEEAFIKSGANVFDTEALRKLETSEPKRFRISDYATPSPRVVPNDEGHLSIWKKPEKDGVYVLGADTAEGLAGGDFSSLHVLEAGSGALVATWHGRIPADIFGDIIHNVGIYYNNALACVEANNHGLTTITRLRQEQYPKLFQMRHLNRIYATATGEYGFKTTRQTKPILIDDLGTWLRQEPVLPCEQTIREMTTYVVDERGQMHGSPHDDRVISLALAVQMLQFAFIPEYEDVKDNYMTFDWWAALLDPPQSTSVVAPLR